MVCRIIWNNFAEFNQTLSQVRNNVVHQVLTNRLWTSIQQVSLLLPDLFKLLSLRFLFFLAFNPFLFLLNLTISFFLLSAFVLHLLALNDFSNFILIAVLNFFDLFFLYRCRSLLFQKLLLGKSCRSFRVEFRFTLLIWLCLISCLPCCLCKLLLTQLFCNKLFSNPLFFSKLSQKLIITFCDQVQAAGLSILLKQFLHLLKCLWIIFRWNSWYNHTVVSTDMLLEELGNMLLWLQWRILLPEDFESSVHPLIVEMGAFCLVLWQLLYSLLQEVVLGVEDNAKLW